VFSIFTRVKRCIDYLEPKYNNEKYLIHIVILMCKIDCDVTKGR